MSSICHAPGSDTATRDDTPDYPCDYPCVLENARDACREALDELYREQPAAGTHGALSRPEYWVGHLGFLMEYLLAATELPGD